MPTPSTGVKLTHPMAFLPSATAEIFAINSLPMVWTYIMGLVISSMKISNGSQKATCSAISIRPTSTMLSLDVGQRPPQPSSHVATLNHIPPMSSASCAMKYTPVMDMALKTNNSPNSTARKVFGTAQPCCYKTPRNSPK